MPDIELKEFLELKINDLEKNLNLKLDRIEYQTTKTNGTVKDLNAWKSIVCQPLEEMIADKKDNHTKVRNLVWQVIVLILLGIMTSGVTVFLVGK